ncbi:DNA internalization-related competence protein ComEC/Rec2 [Guyparkeria sp.]|uniref:DNA internalization-related competence protein ComEC/Rec2 n=1 Tax=Guyparkeria sp. TaxID=2035736 RepID=UPI0039708D3A
MINREANSVGRWPSSTRSLLLAWPAGALLAWLLPWTTGGAPVWLAPLTWPGRLALSVPQTTVWLGVALLPLVLLGWWIGFRRVALMLALLAGLAHSLGSGAVLIDRTPSFDERIDCHLAGTVRGLIDDRPDRRRFVIAVDEARAVDTNEPSAREGCRSIPSGGRLRLSDYTPAEERTGLEPGHHYRLTARLKPLHEYANPGGFDYRRWLFRHHLLATGYLRDGRPVSLGQVDGLVALVDRVRYRAQARLEEVISRVGPAGPDRSNQKSAGGALLLGLAIGDRSGLDDDRWEALLATGTNHLLAISGLHVGMIAALVGLFARAIWPRLVVHSAFPAQWAAAAPAVTAAWAYALVAGLSIPTLRAALMLTILLLGVLGRRRWRLFDLWLVAFVLVVAIDPFAPLDMGFWLSFAAVLLILAVIQGRTRWTGLVGLVRLQWLLMLGLLPLTWWLFDRVAFASLPANLLAVPLVSILVTPLALFTLFLAGFSPALAAWPALAIEHVGRWLFEVLDRLVAVFPESTVGAPPGPWLFLLVLGVGWLLLPRGWPAKPLALLLLLPALLVTPNRPPTGQFEALVMDVGQGTAVLLRTARHDMLYDAGPRWGGFDTGEAVVLPTLRAEGVSRLDRIVVSHAAGDHAGGLPSIRARFPRAEIMGAEKAGFGIQADEVSGCPHGHRWRWDGVTFTLLQAPMRSANNRSCVLKVEGRTGALLLTGDIEKAAERWLVRHADVAADIVLVPHHGSSSSSTPAFVEAVGAEVAVVSAGFLNRWDHPRPEVVARWESSNARVLRTDRGGALRLGADDPVAERDRRWRFAWRLADPFKDSVEPP